MNYSDIHKEVKLNKNRGGHKILVRGGSKIFQEQKKLIIRNKIKGLGQGFRNNKKIVQELGRKLKD